VIKEKPGNQEYHTRQRYPSEMEKKNRLEGINHDFGLSRSA
jgi:hypothetical protein